MSGGGEGDVMLAAYACSEERSRGRSVAEAEPEYRGEFQRDRDRVIHSAAFRRLEYKTQVFVNHEGDLFRTRLTHSIEVAQIARTIARALGLNEDLAEAIALAHDLGHTPFGHAGQSALNACMEPFGGFEHNLQSLRVVDLLEERYAAFRGLNLCYETREGILKHCSRANARALGEIGRRFLEGGQASLEAQLVNLADEIAYNNHDVDDGLRAGLLDAASMLDELPHFAEHRTRVLAEWPGIGARRLVHEVVRRMVNEAVVDLVRTTRAALEQAAPGSVEDVRRHPVALVGFSDAGAARQATLKRYLHGHLYRHHRVHRMTRKAQRIVGELFAAFMDDPRLLSAEPRARLAALESEDGPTGRARAVADYVAGMTDRYAIAEHQRLFDVARLA